MNTIIKAMDAVYFEIIFPLKSVVCPNPSNIELLFQISSYSYKKRPKRSKGGRVEKNLGDNFVIFIIEDTPTTYQEYMDSPDSVIWKEAINDEHNSVMNNNTWILTSLSLENKPLG